jgi:hypothetical protein
MDVMDRMDKIEIKTTTSHRGVLFEFIAKENCL